MDWAKTPESRKQAVLFEHRLDDAISGDHVVRLFDEILSQVDWTSLESLYERRRGQPPIRPRILASVILYGMLKRILSSRSLEEALQVRLDFRWLAEGRSIDHTTLSEFRRKNSAALKDLFVQVGMVAQEMGCLPLQTLAFDGTRILANNRRNGIRTLKRLREIKERLEERFSELQENAAEADTEADKALGDLSGHDLSEELSDVQFRLKRVEAALAEVKRLEDEGGKVPERIALTDPECRVMPNKDSGHAPNYTPLATVDVDSGIIVSCDVIANTDEDKHLTAAIIDVQEQFHLENPPGEMLADTLNSTGENLSRCAEMGVELYAPLKGHNEEQNPALRDDITRPVPQDQIDNLPKCKVTRGGKKLEQFDKQAFVYEEETDSYWCPSGKQLTFHTESTETRNGQTRVRRRFRSDKDDCSHCALLEMCIQNNKHGVRTVQREQHETFREAHAEKMKTEAAKEKYSRRRAPGERPFATIKHQFGVRQFLRRGLVAVKDEWTWLVTAFNIQRLIGLMQSGVGPPVPDH